MPLLASTEAAPRWCDGSARDAPGSWRSPSGNRWSPHAVYGPNDNQTSFVLGMYLMAETPVAELSRRVRGVQDRYHHCSQKSPKRRLPLDQQYFEHTSGCQRLGVLEAARRLVSHGLRPFFIGDSVMNQLWLTVWKARRFVLTGTDQRGLERWPNMAILPSLCGVVGADIEFMVDRALRDAARPDAAEWGVPCSENDVLLLSLGLHYNLHQAACAPSDYGDLREQILRESPSLARMEREPAMEPLNVSALNWLYEKGRDASVNCPTKKPNHWTPGNEDKPCTEMFYGVCGSLPQDETKDTPARSHCDYVRDLRRLAIWLEANRARLPHIFFLDSAPQRITLSRNNSSFHGRSPDIVRLSQQDSGQWRNVIARAVFARHAPTAVTYVRFAELLLGQQGWRGHLDTAHWCIDSLAWEEATSAVLTALYAHATTARARGPRSARCTRADRLPNEGEPSFIKWQHASRREVSEQFGFRAPTRKPFVSEAASPASSATFKGMLHARVGQIEQGSRQSLDKIG